MMQENTHRQTLVQIQLRYPFDRPTLAQQAGLETQIVSHALLQKPISPLKNPSSPAQVGDYPA